MINIFPRRPVPVHYTLNSNQFSFSLFLTNTKPSYISRYDTENYSCCLFFCCDYVYCLVKFLKLFLFFQTKKQIYTATFDDIRNNLKKSSLLVPWFKLSLEHLIQCVVCVVVCGGISICDSTRYDSNTSFVVASVIVVAGSSTIDRWQRWWWLMAMILTLMMMILAMVTNMTIRSKIAFTPIECYSSSCQHCFRFSSVLSSHFLRSAFRVFLFWLYVCVC